MAHDGVRSLFGSAFLRGHVIVSVADHVYVCGRQHMQPSPATFRACDTAALVLQSAAAAARWPTTPRKLAQLAAAFRKTNPAASPRVVNADAGEEAL